MKRRLSKDEVLNLTVYVVLIAVALWFVVGAAQYTGRQRLVPWVIGIPTIGLLAFIVIAELTPRLRGLTFGKGSGDEAVGAADGTRVEAGSWKRVVTVYGWLLFFLAATFVLGFYVAVPIFLWLFFTFESRLNPAMALSITATCAVPLYLVFRLVLDVPLWPGILPMVIPGIIGGGRIPPLL